MRYNVRPFSRATLLRGLAATVSCSLVFTLLLGPWASRPALAALARKAEVSTADAFNPKPSDTDIILPMPCGLSMVFKLVAVPAKGLLWDMPMRPGVDDTAHQERAYYDRRFNTALSGTFTLDDLPAAWRKLAPQGQNFFYLVAKYEVSNLQWRAIMDNTCPDTAQPGAEAARSTTDISWYDAVDFTRRYTTCPQKRNGNMRLVGAKPLAANCCCRRIFLPCNPAKARQTTPCTAPNRARAPRAWPT